MNFNAWMPLQGTTGNSYDYTTKKSGKSSQKENSPVKNSGKDQETVWKFPTETYVPSVEAQKYKTQNKSSQKVEQKQEVTLSKNAQKLLEELKEKYSNMDFFVASYSSEEEAQRYLGRGTKEYSVLIDPETLEAMAADESVRAQYEDILSGAGDKLTELKEQLGEDADQVKSFGISIDQEGKVSYFAELDKISESREKQLEKAKEKKAEEKKEERKNEAQKAEARKREKAERFFKADSIEELVEKIRTAMADKEFSDEIIISDNE